MQTGKIPAFHDKGTEERYADRVAQGHEHGLRRKEVRHLSKNTLEDEGESFAVTWGLSKEQRRGPWEWGTFLVPMLKYCEEDGKYDEDKEVCGLLTY